MLRVVVRLNGTISTTCSGKRLNFIHSTSKPATTSVQLPWQRVGEGMVPMAWGKSLRSLVAAASMLMAMASLGAAGRSSMMLGGSDCTPLEVRGRCCCASPSGIDALQQWLTPWLCRVFAGPSGACRRRGRYAGWWWCRGKSHFGDCGRPWLWTGFLGPAYGVLLHLLPVAGSCTSGL